MVTHAADAPAYPARVGRGDRRSFCMDVDIGASGAPTVSHKDDPGFSISRTDPGKYSLVFPKCARATITGMVVSSALTRETMTLTAIDANAGTATLEVQAAGTTGELANGDALQLKFDLDVTPGI